MIIYCSKKLESFIEKLNVPSIENPDTFLGEWNGHLFSVGRRKCLIFMHNKTAYSFVVLAVTKKILEGFGQTFKNRLILQFCNDLDLSTTKQEELRQSLEFKGFLKTNNDRAISGSINHHIEVIKFSALQEGGIENLDELEVSNQLNNYPMGTKIEANDFGKTGFFMPIQAMNKLISD